MRLLVKRGLSLVNDLHFEKGPIYIGRLPKCQVFLPDHNVSRQHAVVYTTSDDVWMAQDLESSNCTSINGRPITKVPLHEGDIIEVADFSIEVHIEPERAIQSKHLPLDLNDTVVDSQISVSPIYQTSREDSHKQTLHLSARHLQDFYHLNFALFNMDDQEELLSELTKVLLGQFEAYHVWGGLRETTSGPLTCHCGRSRGGQEISLDGLLGKDIIKQALHQETYILLPNFAEFFDPSESHPPEMGNIKSAMAAPIVAPAGVYGVIYLNNGIDQEPYNQRDLNYLTLVSVQIAAILEHIG